ncbi:MAG: PilZ domain-containing protein [Deltaproteobacteria bacterium]|nr:PilZ domain-containing protein [Deltaproteobacteria bacterium]
MQSLKGLMQKRRPHRRNVKLRGCFLLRDEKRLDNDKGDDAHDIKVENISQYGIRFRLLKPLEVKVNDTLQVKFVFENERRSTVVEKDIVVKWTQGDFVGAHFVRPIDDYESELAFYLSGARL